MKYTAKSRGRVRNAWLRKNLETVEGLNILVFR